MKALASTAILVFLTPILSYGLTFYGISSSNGLTSYTESGTPTSLSSTNGNALALDQTNSHIYIGTATGITRTDIDGSNATTISTEGDPIGGITLDVSNQKIYYTVNVTGDRDIVRSINFNGTGATTLVSSPVSSRIARQIDIDTVGQKIYWTEGVSSGSGGVVRRANLNGSSAENVNISSTSNPFGIAVDGTEPQLYGTLAQSGTVYKANLDGSNSQSLKSALAQVSRISGDYANDHIYYVYSGGSRLGRVGTDGTGDTFLFNLQSGTGQVVGDFSPVPEPSTYALILSVIACLVACLWKRRREHARN